MNDSPPVEYRTRRGARPLVRAALIVGMVFVVGVLGYRLIGGDRYGWVDGQTVNVSSLARDAGVAPTTIAGYVEILEDTLIAWQLPAFEARLRVRERRRPKLYFADPGIPRALKGHLSPPAPEERGHLFEGWVAGVLRAYRDYSGLFDEWGYWSPAGARHTEVDLILRKDDRLIAVEVKTSDRLTPKGLKGLRAVAEMPGIARRILVVPAGPRRRTEEGIEILPALEFAHEAHTGALAG